MTVRIGFVGVGGIATTHLETIATTGDADVVAIFDLDVDTARSAAERWNATRAQDLEELVSHPDLDAVFVCVPPDAHGPPEKAAARRGLALFVEKPVARRTTTALEINDAIDRAGILTMVGHHWRYARAFEHARSILAGRPIGYLDGRWWGGVPGGPDHWWGREEHSGGQVIEQAIHVFDAIRYLNGEVDSVCAAGARRLIDHIDFPDVSSATMTHVDGSISHVSASSAAVESRMGIEAIADDATISVSESRVIGTVDGAPVDERYEDDPYRREVLAFIDAVRTGSSQRIRSPYRDSVRSLALSEAVTRAIEQKRRVDVSEVLDLTAIR